MRVFLKTLGCAKNDVDSDYLIGYFKDHGFTLTKDPRRAEIAVLNSCGFILPAKEESINTMLGLAELKSTNLKALMVFGCLAKRYYGELKKDIPEVDLFVPSVYPQEVAAAFGKYLRDKALWPVVDNGSSATSSSGRKSNAGSRSSSTSSNRSAPGASSSSAFKTTLHRSKQTKSYAYLKIADGCSSHCSYCAIPLIKGPYKSRPLGEIVTEAKDLAAGGVKELILIAQDTARYGFDLPQKTTLAKLLAELDALDITGIRMLYQKPESITPMLLKACRASTKFIPYFDIPIQHLSTPVVSKMNRAGSAEKINRLFAEIRALFPDAILRSSVIIGFPTETDANFEELLTGLSRIKFDYMSIFPFSPEEGTRAGKLKQINDEQIISQRLNRVLDIQDHLLEEKNRKRVGRQTIITVDEKTKYSVMSIRDKEDKMAIMTEAAVSVAASSMNTKQKSRKKSVPKEPFGIIKCHDNSKVPETDGNIYMFIQDEASFKAMKIGDRIAAKISGYFGYDLVAERSESGTKGGGAK